MKIGIDKIAFYTPGFYIEQKELAEARMTDPNKFLIGLGQTRMSVMPSFEDPITMGAHAAQMILTNENKKNIDLIIFATESGVDHSKAGATFIHELLNLDQRAKAIEIKQACYGLTAGIQLAYGHLLRKPNSNVLIIGSDVARYGLNTGGEPTQGAGAVAVLMSQNPSILTLEPNTYEHTENIYDFWRPNYSEAAFVDGHYSNEKYQEFFLKTYQGYLKENHLTKKDFQAFCLHIPYTKIGLKALKSVLDETEDKHLFDQYQLAVTYNKQVGNIYTGSLYLSLISLLEKGNLKAGDRIGLFSYGSGAVGEFFSGMIVKGYENHLLEKQHESLLNQRQKLSIETYEKVFNQKETLKPNKNQVKYLYQGEREHKRVYEIIK